MSRLNRVPLTRHKPRPRVNLTRPRPTPEPNTNSNPVTNDPQTIINIQDIATQVPSNPNVWIINKDVIISPTEYLGNDKTTIYITSYNFTNYGEFYNGGIFITTNSFTNYGKIGNNGAVFINTGILTFNPHVPFSSTIAVFNRNDGKIISRGTYSGKGIVIGNPVQTITLPPPPPT